MGILRRSGAPGASVQPPRSGPDGAHPSRGDGALQVGPVRACCLNRRCYAAQVVVLAPFLGFVGSRGAGRAARRRLVAPTLKRHPECQVVDSRSVLGCVWPWRGPTQSSRSRCGTSRGAALTGSSARGARGARLGSARPPGEGGRASSRGSWLGRGRAGGWRLGSARAGRSPTIAGDRKKYKFRAAADPVFTPAGASDARLKSRGRVRREIRSRGPVPAK